MFLALEHGSPLPDTVQLKAEPNFSPSVFVHFPKMSKNVSLVDSASTPAPRWTQRFDTLFASFGFWCPQKWAGPETRLRDWCSLVRHAASPYFYIKIRRCVVQACNFSSSSSGLIELWKALGDAPGQGIWLQRGRPAWPWVYSSTTFLQWESFLFALHFGLLHNISSEQRIPGLPQNNKSEKYLTSPGRAGTCSWPCRRAAVSVTQVSRPLTSCESFHFLF